MNNYEPYLASLLSGLIIPGLFILARWQKSNGDKRSAHLEEKMVEQAEVVAQAASGVAISVAEAAVKAGEATELRLIELLERNNADVKLAISRLDSINGKVADVTLKQSVDHDNVVWLLGKAGEAIIRKDNP